jgi:hypothetical protein
MGGSAKESQLGASLAAEVLEIRDTWLRFSSLEILKQDGLPRNTEEITASI